eukprot:13952795-Ditylum_brightwellii.AAC.1
MQPRLLLLSLSRCILLMKGHAYINHSKVPVNEPLFSDETLRTYGITSSLRTKLRNDEIPSTEAFIY